MASDSADIIAAPRRLAMLEEAILAGQPVDAALLRRLAILQAIDAVNVGAAYAEQAARRQRAADDAMIEAMRTASGGK